MVAPRPDPTNSEVSSPDGYDKASSTTRPQSHRRCDHGFVARTRLWGAHRFVTRYVNPVTSMIAGWAPGFGIVVHEGRRTARTYRTPVNVFRSGDKYLFVLTYGSDAQWIKNVLAAGQCELQTRRQDLRLVEPELTLDPDLEPAPILVRFIGRLFRITEYLTMREA